MRNFSVSVLAFLLLLADVGYCFLSIPSGQLQLIRLTQLLAWSALFFLYLFLLIPPLRFAFPRQLQKIVLRRRDCVIAILFFGILHGLCAFFSELGGVNGLRFLDNRYIIALSLSGSALLLLLCMSLAVHAVRYPHWMTRNLFQAGLYVVSILVLLHAAILGTHFSSLQGWLPKIIAICAGVLLIFESYRADFFLRQKYMWMPKFGVCVALAAFGIGVGILFLGGAQPIDGLNIHAQHIQIARDAQQSSALQGDRTRRYTVSFSHPSAVNSGQSVTLQFQVFDANTGKRIELFSPVYTKLLHLIVIDENFQYFSHIHPELTDQDFTTRTSFPKPGMYHLYLDFQPTGAIEQQFAFTLQVGDAEHVEQATTSATLDSTQTVNVDGYTVALRVPQTLKASDLSVGLQTIGVHVTKTDTGEEVKTLRPYLGAYGHLSMIQTQTFSFVHVHPNDTAADLKLGAHGPDEVFLPLGLYRPIQPGMYRLYVEINPDNHLVVAQFTVKIE